MSLQVYNKTDPPISVIVDNDTYFDGHTELDSGDMCAGILKVIDKAVYNSPATFIGRDPSLGALYKQHLSTGTKTLLNVLNHPDKCFSTIECGYNAISYMLNFKQGNVYIPNTFIFSPGLTSDNIDIVWDGKHFTKLSKFNVLWGESGSGKTFLFSKIKSYLQDAVVVYDSGDLSFNAEICKCIDYGLYTFPGKYYFSGGFKELTVDCTM